jgi:hypothetical protein
MFSTAFKGWYGEFCGNLAQSIFLDPKIYCAINDVTIPTGDGGTTQIDHVIVSQYGIFVIEAKFMDGWIFGSQSQKYWTQCFPKRKFKFQNPLHQNYRHTKALSEFLKIEHSHFHSVVMFWGDSTFKTPMPENVLEKGYSAYIKSKTKILFTQEQVKQILDAIRDGALPRSWSTHSQHVHHLKQKHSSSEQVPVQSSLNTQSCPECDGTLVKRVAKRGKKAGNQFYGCSNFPKCRYVAHIPSN